MKVGCSTLSVFHQPAAKAIETLAAYGFEVVEIMCESPHAHPYELSRQDREAIKRTAHREGVGILLHAPIADVNLMSSNPGARAESARQLTETLRLAHDLECPRVVFHVGGRPYMGLYDFEKGYRDLTAGIEPLLREASRLRIELLMENDPQKPGLGAIELDVCQRILGSFDGNLLFLLDGAHAFMLGEDAPGAFIRALAPYLRGVHLSNNDGKLDYHKGLDGGKLNIQTFIGQLRDAHYKEEIVIEIMPEEDLRRSKAILDRLIAG